MTERPEPMCDSHAHLNFPDFEGQVLDILRRATEAGVEAIINIGTQPSTNAEVLRQVITLPGKAREAGFEPPALHATVGFHPHEAKEIVADDWDTIERLAAEPEVVALGEFGLDYHYEHSPRADQRDVLRRGIDLAIRTGLPLVIHSREAKLEVIEALDRATAAPGAEMPHGVFHCFTDTLALAEAALERGFHIGITGIVTFPKAQNVRDVAARIPLERLLVETDAPFCAPVPLRGKTNEPAFVAHVADKIAELHNVTPEEIRRTTLANTRRLFGLA
jgi:TatD DNase family protein